MCICLQRIKKYWQLFATVKYMIELLNLWLLRVWIRFVQMNKPGYNLPVDYLTLVGPVAVQHLRCLSSDRGVDHHDNLWRQRGLNMEAVVSISHSSRTPLQSFRVFLRPCYSKCHGIPTQNNTKWNNCRVYYATIIMAFSFNKIEQKKP